MLFWCCNLIKLDGHILGVCWITGTVGVCVNQCKHLQFLLRRVRLA